MRRGFSLLELAMVVAVSGLMLGYMLQAGTISNNKECYVSTKVQLQAIRNAIDIFARKNDRLPMPAARNVGIESTTYGREASGADIDTVGTASWGALPFQTLGMPSTFAGDCWGNKFTYVVTTALTTDNTSGGFKDSTVIGTLTQKTTTTVNFSTTTAYAVISHGEDGLGAVKLNYSAANPSHGWCAGVDLKHLNCLATNADVGAGVFNNGKDAGTAYFDDLVAASGKPQIIEEASGSNIYCWGDNTYGQIGDGTNTLQTAPTPITLPTGVNFFVSLSVGSYHSCGIADDGNTYCWGAGNDGRLGTGNTTSQNVPTLVTGGLSFKQVSAAGGHTCGITTAGATYCWGYDGSGQLGKNTYWSHVSSPTVIHGGSPTFTRIYSGGENSCGLTADNTPYCWGRDYDYTLGDDALRADKATPQLVDSGTHKFIKLGIGANVICGLKPNGEVYCWGNGGSGTVGDGNTDTNTSPVPVTGGYTFTDIVGGGDHMCALRDNGKAYCWGYNGFGAAGFLPWGWGASDPVPVSMGAYDFTQLDANYYDSCGVTDDGKVYCWGNNTWSNLGDGTTTEARSPVQVTGTGTVPLYFTQVGTGERFTCAMKKSTAPVAWGDNTHGQLGDGTTTARNEPVNITMPSGVSYFTKIVAGTYHSCGLSVAGTAYCWGNNTYGQVGDATTGVDRLVPTPVGGTPIAFTDIVAGNYHTCAITAAGASYCWGRNDVGQLGDATNTNRDIPTATAVGTPAFTQLATGYDATCGLTGAGATYCWGDNFAGTLGNGTSGGSNSTPTAVVGGTPAFASIGAGWHFCGVTSAGVAHCWGNNGYGQIGNGGAPGFEPTPVQVTSGAPPAFTQIDAGDNTSCARTEAGIVYCWGRDTVGMIGDGNGTEDHTPSPTALAGTMPAFSTISTGMYHSCALTYAGDVYCWGNNDVGQLGAGSTGGYGSTPTKINQGYLTIGIISAGFKHTIAQPVD